MNRLLEDSIQVLKYLGDNWTETSKITSIAGTTSTAILFKLQSFGFVERVILDELSPLTKSMWRITKEGKAFVRSFDGIKSFENEQLTTNDESFQIVMTLPSYICRTFLHDHPSVGLTSETLQKMFSEAKTEICIISPYIDASISFLMQGVDETISVRVLTTPSTGVSKKEAPNATLERLSKVKNFSTRYIRESFDRIQIYQIHAKLVLIDKKYAYIGSANLKETSIFHNFELGYIINEPRVILELYEIFEDIYLNYSMGRESLL